MKKCSNCKKEKLDGEFHRYKTSLQGYCKQCQNEKTRAWHRLNPNKSKQQNLRWKNRHPDYDKDRCLQKKWGMTREDFVCLLDSQGGGCAICGKTEDSDRRLAIDHSHRTKKIRGILCNNCNNMLGRAYDSVTILRTAINYLEKHNEEI